MQLSPEAKQKRNEYARQYREKNRERIRKNHKSWRAANRERITEYTRSYWERLAQQTDSPAQ